MEKAFGFKTITYKGLDVSVPIPDFPYRPLDAGAREIRLLQIIPADDVTAPIKATVTHHSLENVPYYTALSYEWGDPSLWTTLSIDDSQFPVTLNLEKALRRLRVRQQRLIWIDSICIDQNNKKEKNSQLILMKDIYHQADSVTVWLGEVAHGSEKVMQMLHLMDMSRRPAHGSEEAPWSPDDLCIRSHEKELKDFLHRTYWRRVWIVQEIALSSKTVVFCGPADVRWKALELLCEQIEAHELFCDEIGLAQLQHLCRSREEQVQGRSVSLLQAILDSRQSLATDPRDKVYALLGLTFDHEHYVTQPHYEWSPTEICHDITKTVISNKRSLDIIFHRSGKADASLPSWCPNYLECDESITTRHLLTYLAGQDQRYRAGEQGVKWRATNDSLATRDVVQIDKSKEHLITRGVSLGTITGLGNNLADPPSTPAQQAEAASGDEPHEEHLHESIDIYSRINRALAFYDSTYAYGEDCIHIYYFLYTFDNYMVDFRSKIELGGKEATIQAWRERNKDFQVHGKGLRKRAHGLRAVLDSGEYKDKLLSAGTIALGAVFTGLINGMTGTQSTYQPNTMIKNLPSNLSVGLSNLISLIEEEMRIMTTDYGNFGWAHPDSKVADEVFLLTGCSMPVVLRPVSDGTYIVIGHAYVDGAMNGDHWAKFDEGQMQSIRLS